MVFHEGNIFLLTYLNEIPPSVYKMEFQVQNFDLLVFHLGF